MFIYLDFKGKDDIIYLTFVIEVKYKKGEGFKDLSLFYFFENCPNCTTIYKAKKCAKVWSG